jgi:hypothetical protein
LASCLAGSKLTLYVQASSFHDRVFCAADALLASASPKASAATNGGNLTTHEFAEFMTTSPRTQELREGE